MELLLRVCRTHRSAMPIYLSSARDELHLIDGIIDKLLQASS